MRMTKTGYTCIRRSLCLMNLLFWVIGCCLLGIGVWLSVSLDTYNRILPSYHLLSFDNLVIFTGVMTILIAFCGCCGAWFQSKCLLGTFLTFIVIVMILQIIAGVLGFVFRQTIRDTLKDELIDGIKLHYNNDSNGLVTAWDQVQSSLNCCGVNGYKDWYKSNAWPTEDWVPESCCIPNDTISSSDGGYICGRNKQDVSRFYNSGCYSRIKRWLLENLHFIGIACVVFAFVQFFAIVSSLLVICTMDYKRQYRPQNGDYRSTYNRVPTL